jgi:hypothetical protein
MNIETAEKRIDQAMEALGTAGQRLAASQAAHEAAVLDVAEKRKAHEVDRGDATWEALLAAQRMVARRTEEMAWDQRAYDDAQSTVETAKAQLRAIEADIEIAARKARRADWIARARAIGKAIGEAWSQYRPIEAEIRDTGDEGLPFGLLRAHAMAAVHESPNTWGIQYLNYPQDEGSFRDLLSTLVYGDRQHGSIAQILDGTAPEVTAAIAHDAGERSAAHALLLTNAEARRNARTINRQQRDTLQKTFSATKSTTDRDQLAARIRKLDADYDASAQKDRDLGLGPAVTGLPS